METDLEETICEMRKRTLSSLYHAQSGHPGSALSLGEIVGTLFFREMHGLDKKDGDRFILSKGHAIPIIYAAASLIGYVSPDELKNLRQIESPLQGHPVRGSLPCIHASTGSLGQGLSVGIGYALAKKLQGNGGNVYVIIGDGESQEGQVWEAAMSAPKFARLKRMNPLITILDYNKFQNDGAVSDQMSLEPVGDKWRSFGWHVQEIDGHDIARLLNAYAIAKEHNPAMIIAHTIKGKGVSFMEGKMDWHSRAMKQQEYESAMKELGGYI